MCIRDGEGGLTDLIQFQELVFHTLAGEQLLGSLAVRAVGLAEDRDRVLVDDGLGFRLGCHD